MYTRVTRYFVNPDKKEEFLDVQQEIADTYLFSMGGRVQFLRNQNNTEEWFGLWQFESEELYKRRLEEVIANLSETDLMERLDAVLSAPVKDAAEEYYMFMEVLADE